MPHMSLALIDRQSTWVVLCTHVSYCLLWNTDHALFASLSFAALETWTDVLMRVGTSLVGLNTLRRTALLGSVILHSWSNKILFCTFASSVPLVPC